MKELSLKVDNMASCTGSIYEAVIPKGLQGVPEEDGQPVGVGSVAGGGR